MKKLIITLALFEGALCAQVLPNYLDLSFGYRLDNVSPNSITARTDEGVEVVSENITIHDLSVYQIGAKVRYEPFCNLFGKGSCYVGFIGSGDYHEVNEVTGVLADIRAEVPKGLTVDWDLAAGYQFSYFGTVGFAPIFGWSYNKQQVHFNQLKDFGVIDPDLNGLKYTTSWNGPFLGLDVFGKFFNFLVNVGYEYHWNHWKGHYLLEGQSVHGLSFTNTRRSHNGIGNVFYVDFMWNILCGWTLGACYKYQDFWTRGGDWSIDATTFAEAGFPQITNTNVPNAGWTSHAIIFDIRYAFFCCPLW